jgi:methionine aminopeptidase type I
VVHGIPGDRVLREGDIISIDCGAILDGWHGDAAITVPVGEVAPELLELIRVTEDAMWAGFAAAGLGGHVSDISAAVERHVRGSGPYGILEDYSGHGIGTAMHQPPPVFNYGRPGRGERIRPGLVLALEPMVTLGRPDVTELSDGWTVVTDDGLPAAHSEHTFTVTTEGTWVLTALDGGRVIGSGAGRPHGRGTADVRCCSSARTAADTADGHVPGAQVDHVWYAPGPRRLPASCGHGFPPHLPPAPNVRGRSRAAAGPDRGSQRDGRPRAVGANQNSHGAVRRTRADALRKPLPRRRESGCR